MYLFKFIYSLSHCIQSFYSIVLKMLARCCPPLMNDMLLLHLQRKDLSMVVSIPLTKASVTFCIIVWGKSSPNAYYLPTDFPPYSTLQIVKRGCFVLSLTYLGN